MIFLVKLLALMAVITIIYTIVSCISDGKDDEEWIKSLVEMKEIERRNK